MSNIQEQDTRIPNADIATEQCYLGNLLLSKTPQAQVRITSLLSEESFWRPAHRLIFRAITRLCQRGINADIITMRAELDRLDALGICGGPDKTEDYLLDCADKADQNPNWESYAKMISELAELRAHAERGHELTRLVDDGESIEKIRRVYAEPLPIKTFGDTSIMDISKIALPDRDEEGVTTGFQVLDREISTGGFPRRQMSMITAYQKSGKTSFMLSCAARQCDSLRVAWITLADMNGQRLKARFLRNVTGWSKEPASGTQAWDDYTSAKGDIDIAWNLTVYDATKMKMGRDVATVVAWLDSRGSEFDVVYLDYAQKLVSSDPKIRTMVDLGDICSTELSACAERNGFALVVGSQITEGTEDRKTITKGSRKWEEDAAWVLRIKSKGDTTKQLEIAYSRFGLQGQTVEMTWNLSRLRFE